MRRRGGSSEATVSTVTGDSVKTPAKAVRSPAAPAPALPTALEEQLGLTLEPRLERVEMLVIDSVESPTGN